MPIISVISKLRVAPEEFWSTQSLDAVNDELRPWIHMSAPKVWRHRLPKEWQDAGVLFKSWVLLLGLFPIDLHAYGSFSFDPQSGVVERSSSWINSAWQHERTTEPTDTGCVVRDRVTFMPRFAPLGSVLAAIYLRVYLHRHKRLEAMYGVIDG
jgi:hypothetical protein